MFSLGRITRLSPSWRRSAAFSFSSINLKAFVDMVRRFYLACAGRQTPILSVQWCCCVDTGVLPCAARGDFFSSKLLAALKIFFLRDGASACLVVRVSLFLYFIRSIFPSVGRFVRPWTCHSLDSSFDFSHVLFFCFFHSLSIFNCSTFY